MRALLVTTFLAAHLAAGCAPGEGAVFMTVDAEGVVRGVDHLRVLVDNAGQTSQPVVIPLSGAPVDIPPPLTFQLRFTRERQGRATVRVAAVDGTGATLAEASTMVDLEPSVQHEATVTLPGTPPGNDLGPDAARDLAPTPDLGPPDLQRLPPPMITVVSPVKGATTGGAVLTVDGRNFAFGATLTVDGLPAPDLQRVSDTHLTAKVPAHPGRVGKVVVAVKNPDGQEAVDAFMYYFGTMVFQKAGMAAPSKAGSGRDLVTADFNEDGKADVATTAGSDVFVFLGKGDATFEREIVIPLMYEVYALRAGDFNGDGHVDLVVASSDHRYQGNELTFVVLGNGWGGFQGAMRFPQGNAEVLDLSVGKLNSDANDDLVVFEDGDSMYLGVGQPGGNFGNLAWFPGCIYCIGGVIADLNGDARQDLIHIGGDPFGFVIRLNSGQMPFAQELPVVPSSAPTAIAVEDFTSDGINDVAVLLGTADSVLLLPGQGNGTLFNPKPFMVGRWPHAVAAVDLDMDGSADMAIANRDSSDLTVLLNYGSGDFRTAATVSLGASPRSLATNDFNGDGAPDLAVVSAAAGGAVTVWLNASQ